jgi:hypothetical protein
MEFSLIPLQSTSTHVNWDEYGFLWIGLYLGEEASFRVADLGQASKEGVVVNGVGPRPPASKPIQC